MSTTVINIKDAPEGWDKLAAYRYIGRAGRGFSGEWGNPFILRPSNYRDEIIFRYSHWFYAPEQAAFRTRAYEYLKDKTLVCFCAPARCHGDVIAYYINNEHESM